MGKTTAAVTLAREFFGSSWRMNFRELNASDERGIDVVRNQIKEFARTRPAGEEAFKILFLDEADALTTDAQAALRRTMESLCKDLPVHPLLQLFLENYRPYPEPVCDLPGSVRSPLRQ